MKALDLPASRPYPSGRWVVHRFMALLLVCLSSGLTLFAEEQGATSWMSSLDSCGKALAGPEPQAWSEALLRLKDLTASWISGVDGTKPSAPDRSAVPRIGAMLIAFVARTDLSRPYEERITSGDIVLSRTLRAFNRARAISEAWAILDNLDKVDHDAVVRASEGLVRAVPSDDDDAIGGVFRLMDNGPPTDEGLISAYAALVVRARNADNVISAATMVLRGQPAIVHAIFDRADAIPVSEWSPVVRRCLWDAPLSESDAHRLVGLALAAMGTDHFAKQAPLWYPPRLLTGQALRFAGSVGNDHLATLDRLLAGSDDLSAHFALWMLLLAADHQAATAIIVKHADRLANRWFADGYAAAASNDDPIQHLNDALVLAFLPGWKPSPDVVGRLRRFSIGTIGPGKQGVTCLAGSSLAIRHDPEYATRIPAITRGWMWAPYFTEFTAANPGLEEPRSEEAMANATKGVDPADLLELAIEYPGWSRAKGIVHDALQRDVDPSDGRQLASLSHLGPERAGLAVPIELAAWLEKMARAYGKYPAALAVIGKLYARALGDSDAAKRTFGQIKVCGKASGVENQRWSWGTDCEVLAEFDQKHPALDDLHARMAAEGSPASAVGEWVLEALRTGRAKEIPDAMVLKAMPDQRFIALAQTMAKHALAFNDVGHRLRSPFVIADCASCGLDGMAAAGIGEGIGDPHMRTCLAYLAAVDRIESGSK